MFSTSRNAALAAAVPFLRTALLAATAALLPIAANAFPGLITYETPTSGSVTYEGTGSGNLNVSQTATTGPAGDNLNFGAVGSYTISALPTTLFTAAGTGVWTPPAGTTMSLTYTNYGNSLSLTLTVTSLSSDGSSPNQLDLCNIGAMACFSGTDVVTAVSGSTMTANFGPVGNNTGTWSLSSTTLGTTLDVLAAGTGSESAGLSSGVRASFAQDIPTPEPATFGLLGTGVLGLGLLARRRRS